jgi:FkbM family methyltransferase
MYSNPALIRLLSTLRSLGILHVIQTSPVYGWISQGYESRFDAAMMASIKPGMRVFDIGANVGYYTQKFAEAVGPTGEVHAFEPVPASAAKVRELQLQYPWIHVHQCAVADQPGEVIMNAEADSTSPTNRIVIEAKDSVSAVGGRGGECIAVPVTTLDQAVAEWGVPAMVKIDVEGYEWHVLRGARDVLTSTDLKNVFVEIHFSLLEARGLGMAGDEITNLLSGCGFISNFTDFSHLQATRP